MSTSLGADQLFEALDEHTLRLLERRKRSPRVRGRGWLVRRALLGADLLGLAVAFSIAQLIYTAKMHNDGAFSRDLEFLTFIGSLPAWILGAKLYGLYERDEERADHTTPDDFNRLFHLITIATFLLYALSYLTSWFHPEFPKLLLFWVLAIIATTAFRACGRGLCRRNVGYLQNTLIVGAGDVGQLIARKIIQHREYGLNLVGFIDDDPKARREDLGHLTLLGGLGDLAELVDLLDVERVIVAFSNASAAEVLRSVRTLRNQNVQIDVVPRLFDLVGPRATVHDVEGLPVLSLRPAQLSRSSLALKRALDIVGSVLALVLLAPLLAYIAWRIRRDSPGPVLFRQARLGMNERRFTCLKFRSMRVDTDPAEHEEYIARTAAGAVAQEASGLFKLDQRSSVTAVGEWLRRTSLDELPQFFNVLRGDMSLVGPRPCIEYETQHFSEHHFERFAVPAGITGLWQVAARANSTFSEALDLDVAYVRSWSLALDLRLLAKTPGQLFRSGGATL